MIKHMLFTGWHFMRWFRLIAGIIIGYQAIQFHDPIPGLIAAFFIYQAITNKGCCGTNNCVVPYTKVKEENIEEVTYTEIK